MDPEQDTQDDDLMAGFESDPTETPDRTEQPQDETPAAAEPPQQAAPKYAQITEDEYLSLKATAAKIPEIEARFQQQQDKAFGKIGGLERLIQESRASGGGLAKEDVDQFRGDFPELASVLDKMVGAKQSFNADEVVKPAITELERKWEMRAVKRAHPDWQEVSQSQDFRAWAAAKPPEFQQQLAVSWDSDFLADTLTEFKQARKAPAAPPPPKGSSRKDVLASAIQPRGSVAHQGGNDEDEFTAGFNAG
jgi:Arc/MetJ-type ribon-helix-helix transcriptional regulator